MKILNSGHRWMLLLALVGFAELSYSQIQISGAVTDNNDGPLSYANVLLLNASDSTLTMGAISDENGSYVFDRSTLGDYLVQVTMIGYQDEYSQLIQLSNETKTYALPVIKLQEDAALLSEVEVVEKRALFEQKIDRLVVNVDNSIALTGTTALEVLKRSPGVAVNPQSNSVSMSGKDGVIIMINGKISRMPQDAVVQMLSGMSSDNIEKIELIHTPPANFEAEGNAGFINIVLKKSQDEGFNGGFSLNAGYGKKEKAGASIYMNFRKKKVNLFGDYSWKYNNNPQLFTNARSFYNDGIFFKNEGESVREPTITHVQNARVGIDINLSSKTIVGALASWSERYWDMDAINDVRYMQDGILLNRVSIPNNEINNDRTYVGNINLQHSFSKDQKFNIDLDYATFLNDNPSSYTNEFYDGNNNLTEVTELRVSKKTPLDIWVGKMDYSQNFGENVIWEAGLKGTTTTFDNDVLVESKEQEVWSQVDLFSSEAMMTENVLAAYSSLFWKLSPKIDIKAGLRYEHADINLGTVSEPNIVDRNRGRWFPSIFLSNQLDEDNKLQLSYSRRIDRPSFKQLAPWFIFFDPTTVDTGNPTLRASISNAIRASYSWKTVQVDFQYTHTNNLIGRFQPSVDIETNTQVNGSKNFDDALLAAMTVSFPVKITSFWEFRSSWTAQWTRVNDNAEGENLSFENTSWYANGSSTIKLPKQFSLEMNGVYFSPALSGIIVWQSFNRFDIGIQKVFNNNNGTLKFAVSDLFTGGNWDGELDDPDIDFKLDSYFGFAERVFRLTYSRQFGNSKLKGQRKRATGSAEEQRRVQ